MEELLATLPRTLRLAGCTIDFAARAAQWPDGGRSLTPTETKLLAYLVSQDGAVVSQRDLLREVWGYRGGVISRTVKTTMGRLRAKVERDAGAPDHLVTVVGAGYRFQATDPRPEEATIDEVAPTVGDEPRHDLPTLDGPMLGRSEDLEHTLDALSEGRRLVTITGAAGVGKSRLAIEAGRQLVDDLAADEVRLVESAGALTEEDLVASVAGALGIELAGDEAEPGLAAALRGRGRLVLILDNLEQALAAARAFTTTLLSEPGSLRIVATSREPLSISEELTVTVGPLQAAAAAELFLCRAGADVLAGYKEPQTLAAVLEKLDGLPLAIELAAGWASFLAPSDLQSRLARQLDLLKAQRPDRPARHGSLRAAIASSWELLSDVERTALVQLSTFVGAAPVDAVDAVLELSEEAPLPVVRRLCARSLARQVPPPDGSSGSPWLTLFEAVRQFASEQPGAGDAEVRHGQWYRWLGDPDSLEALEARGTAAGLGQLVTGRADLVEAARRAIDRGDAEVASGCVEALLAVGRFRGPLLAYGGLLDSTLALDALGDEERASLLLAGAEGLLVAGRQGPALAMLDRIVPWAGAGAVLDTSIHRARARALLHSDLAAATGEARAAVAAAGVADDPSLRARCHGTHGAVLRAAGQIKESRAELETALDLARATCDRRTETRMLDELGRIDFHRGRPVRALSMFEAALTAAEEIGDRPMEATLLDAVASLQALHDRRDEACELLERSLALRRELGDRGGEAGSSISFGGLKLSWGDCTGARPLLEEGLAIALEVRSSRLEAAARGSMGELMLALGRHGNAERQLTGALALAEELGHPRMRALFLGLRGELQFAQGQADVARVSMLSARTLLADASLRSDLHDLLMRWSEREADLGELDRSEELHHEAVHEAELSMADEPASVLGR